MIPIPGELWEWRSEANHQPFWHYRVRVDSELDGHKEFKATLVQIFQGPNDDIFNDGQYSFNSAGGAWTRIPTGYCASCDQFHQVEDYLCAACREKAECPSSR